MGERDSGYTRDGDDWYVEPRWAVEALRNRQLLIGPVHDPCCGMGTIPDVFSGTGSDLVDRGFGYPVRDFLTDTTDYVNIVTNPPYGKAQQIIEHALRHNSGRIAALVQLNFLASQRRYDLYQQGPTEKVLVLSKRPSMPPGKVLQEKGEAIRGNGSIDYCWVIFCQGYHGPVEIDWAV